MESPSVAHSDSLSHPATPAVKAHMEPRVSSSQRPVAALLLVGVGLLAFAVGVYLMARSRPDLLSAWSNPAAAFAETWVLVQENQDVLVAVFGGFLAAVGGVSWVMASLIGLLQIARSGATDGKQAQGPGI